MSRGWLILVITALLLYPVSARANGLPAKKVEGPRGLILPDRATAVGVDREELVFDFTGPQPNDIVYFPLVTARYRLRNTGSQTEVLDVAFLSMQKYSSPYRDVAVTWEGEQLMVQPLPPRQSLPVDSPLAHLAEVKQLWLDPYTGEVYSEKYPPGATLRADVFTLSVPPGGPRELVVQYRQDPSGEDATHGPGRILHYTYLLSPARHWAFFHGLDIRVLLPSRLKLASLPGLKKEKEADGTAVWGGNFESLPEGELQLSVVPRSWLRDIAPVVNRWYWLGLVVLLLALAARLGMLPRLKRARETYGKS